MIKKVIFGFIWFVVFYISSCAMIGGIAGAIAGSNDPQNASRAGAMAGGAAVESLRIYILLGALALAAYCSKKGFLPGTKIKESR